MSVCIIYLLSLATASTKWIAIYNAETEWAADTLRTPHNAINVNMIFAVIIFSIEN